MLSEILIGAVTNFTTSAANRVLSRVTSAFLTNAEIKNIIQQTSKSSVVGETVEAILARAIGNGLGIYDEALAAIINDVALNGYADAIYNSALTERHNAKELKEKFLLEYSSQLNSFSLDAGAFFDALHYAVDTIVFAKFKDREMAFLIAESHSELCYKIEKYCHVEKDYYSKARFDEFSSRYAKFTQAQNKDVAIETDRGQKKVPIEKIFVKSRLLRIRSEEITNGVIDVKKFSDNSTVLKYIAFSRTFNLACVIGNPGGGKSTLCQFICHDFAKKFNLVSRNPSKTDLDIAVAKLPIKVLMRNFKKLHEKNGYSFIDFIVKDVKLNIDDDEDFIRAWTIHVIRSGKSVVLFDGLDEILDVSERRDYVDLIEAFVHQWPSCPYLCTSRKVGYLKAPLSDRFHIYELAPFNDEEITTYATNAISAIRNVKKDEAGQQARSFLSQTSKNARDLRSNPLMLGLMVWLYLSKGHVPRNRASIYTECALLMFEKWDPNRGILAPIPDDFNMIEMFGYLAKEILGDRDAEAGVTSAWIEAKILKFLTHWYESPSRATSAAKKIRDFVTGRSWVMTDIGAELYGFTHRTFLEYFYAVHLDKQYETIEDLLSHLQHLVCDGSLDVICHLAIQRKCENNRARGSKYTRIINSWFDGKLLGEAESNSIKFLANSMEYMAVSEFDLRSSVSAIISSIVAAEDSNSYEAAKDGLSVWMRNTDPKSIINEGELILALEKEVKQKDKFRIYKIVDQLNARSSVPSASIFQSKKNIFLKSAMDILKPLALTDVFYARLVIEIDRSQSFELLQIHGNQLSAFTAEFKDIMMLAPLFYLEMWSSAQPRGANKARVKPIFQLNSLLTQSHPIEIPIFRSPHLPSLEAATERAKSVWASGDLRKLELFVATTVELLSFSNKNQSIDRAKNPVSDVVAEGVTEPSGDYLDWKNGRYNLFTPLLFR